MSQSFRKGFLFGVASKGVTPEQLEKSALGFGGVMDAAGVLGVGLPLLVGGTTGYVAAEATRPDYNSEIDHMKKKELTRELRQQTRAVARRIKSKMGQGATTGTPSAF